MKKYLYAGVLLGAAALTGCSINDAQINEEITKDATTNQAIEVATSPNFDKEEIILTTLLDLTQEQKEDYYKQYVEIVKEINAEDGLNYLTVVPFDEFEPRGWIKPDKFRQMAIERANLEFTSEAFGGDSVE